MKKELLICSVLSFALFLGFMPSDSYAVDWEYRNIVFVKMPVTEKLSMMFQQFDTWGGGHTQSYTELALNYLKKSGVPEVGFAYREYRWGLPGAWTVERRTAVQAGYSKKLIGLNFVERCKIESRTFDETIKQPGVGTPSNDLRFRNAFEIVIPLNLTKLEICPFIGDEFFYSAKKNIIELNWLYGGLQFKTPINKLSMGVDVRLQHIRFSATGAWTTQKSWGTKLFYVF